MPNETFTENFEVIVMEGKEQSEPITPLSPKARAQLAKFREKYVQAGLLPPLPQTDAKTKGDTQDSSTDSK